MNRRSGDSLAERAVDRVIDGAALLCELTIAAMAVFISLDALLRWLFTWSFLVVDELGGYAMLLLTFFGMAAALHRGALFRVEALIDRLQGRVREVLQFGFDLASLGFAVLLFWQLLGLATRSQAREITAATTLRTPLWWPQAMMAAGVLLLVLALIVQLWRGARRLRAPEQVREHGAA